MSSLGGRRRDRERSRELVTPSPQRVWFQALRASRARNNRHVEACACLGRARRGGAFGRGQVAGAPRRAADAAVGRQPELPGGACAMHARLARPAERVAAGVPHLGKCARLGGLHRVAAREQGAQIGVGHDAIPTTAQAHSLPFWTARRQRDAGPCRLTTALEVGEDARLPGDALPSAATSLPTGTGPWHSGRPRVGAGRERPVQAAPCQHEEGKEDEGPCRQEETR